VPGRPRQRRRARHRLRRRRLGAGARQRRPERRGPAVHQRVEEPGGDGQRWGGCGVGPELAPALGGLLWLIRRRLR
jgi:hypothetical protein